MIRLKSRSSKSIGFIGAGKAGVSLGSYFASKGLEISGYSSRTMESALSAARITGSSAFSSLKELIEHSDTIIISTPDDALPVVWKELQTLDPEGRIVAHLSGSLSSDIFEGIGQKGASGYSITLCSLSATKTAASRAFRMHFLPWRDLKIGWKKSENSSV